MNVNAHLVAVPVIAVFLLIFGFFGYGGYQEKLAHEKAQDLKEIAFVKVPEVPETIYLSRQLDPCFSSTEYKNSGLEGSDKDEVWKAHALLSHCINHYIENAISVAEMKERADLAEEFLTYIELESGQKSQ